MQAKPFKILVVIALTLIMLTAIVAYARVITLSDYKEATGTYTRAWAYVEGKEFLNLQFLLFMRCASFGFP